MISYAVICEIYHLLMSVILTTQHNIKMLVYYVALLHSSLDFTLYNIIGEGKAHGHGHDLNPLTAGAAYIRVFNFY